MHLEEKTISSQEIFDGRVFRVTKDMAFLENGSEAVREVVHHSGGVTVIPITDNNEIIMVRQYRYAADKILLEIPAGKLEKDESHYDAGKRELLEETGCTCSEYKYLGELLPTPAYVTEVIHMYMAGGLEYSEQNLDEDEFLDVVKIPMEKAVEMVLSGEIKDSKTQIGVLKAYHLLNGR
ncbi:MAG: NUDIX hydrolase [Oscillospiraceae bacterium]|nr:NUDIX hydrolase [Oscillospiraceae bacterium]